MATISFRRGGRGSAGDEITVDGSRVGTLMFAYDAEGGFYAWNAFVDGCFGGSAMQNVRHTTRRQAQTAAKSWIASRLKEKGVENG